MLNIEPILLKPTQVAEATGMSRSRIYALIKAGILPSVLIQGVRLIPTDRLRDWIAEQVVERKQA
jgi:excisionase family DNA binding protein